MNRAALLFLIACRNDAQQTLTAPITPSASASVSASVSVSASASVPAPPIVTLLATGIGFDDLAYASSARELLVPAGATGQLVRIDPVTHRATPMHPFNPSPRPYAPGRHGDGVTSAAEGAGLFFATDRTTKVLVGLDTYAHIRANVTLGAAPDYVRFVEDEVWVTEPEASRIEIFDAKLARITTLAVPGGPESLVYSTTHRMAYTNLWHQKTIEIDAAARAIKRTFDTGCDKTRGIALDDFAGVLYVACNDGNVVAVDLKSGALGARGKAGDGVDIIDWSPIRKHLYAPAARAGWMTIFDADLHIVKTVKIPIGAHCVVSDDRGQAWICDPEHGSILVFADNP